MRSSSASACSRRASPSAIAGGMSNSVAARPDQAAAVAVAREGHQQIQALAPHPAEVRRGRLVGDVAGDGAEVADVVGQALELEGDAADGLRPGRLPAPGQRLDRAAGGARVADDGVAGDRLRDQDGVRPAAGVSSRRSTPRCW